MPMKAKTRMPQQKKRPAQQKTTKTRVGKKKK
jgi:hypothetical protein